MSNDWCISKSQRRKLENAHHHIYNHIINDDENKMETVENIMLWMF